MEVTFVDDSYIENLLHSGNLSFGYSSGEEVPEEFGDDHIPLLESLEAAMATRFGEDRIYVSFDIWGDMSLSTYLDLECLNRDAVSFLVKFVRSNAKDFTFWCTVSNFKVKSHGALGRFIFNYKYFLVSSELKNLWTDKVGNDVDWEPWHADDPIH